MTDGVGSPHLNRDKSQNDAQSSLQKMEFIINSSSSAIATASLDGSLTFVNPAFLEMWGYDNSDEIVGRHFNNFWLATDQEAEIMKSLTENSMKWSGELIAKRKDGSTFDVLVSAAAVLDNDGNPVDLMSTSIDITDRKLAEVELIESENRFRTFVGESIEALYLHDIDGSIIEVNETAVRDTGYSRSELLRMSIYDIDPELNNFKELPEIWRKLEPFQYKCFQGNHKKRDGNIYPVEVRTGKIILKGKAFLLVLAQDISERTRVEESLKKRIIALTKPIDQASSISFSDLFDIDEIQLLQDRFAKSAGVASIITDINGNPITAPSNFCHLCMNIIRKTEKGAANCCKSDAKLGRFNPTGPIIQPCLSGGLWDAGAAISVGGKHIANWLIGQVRDETQTESAMRQYAREIETNEDEFIEAFNKVPSMSHAQFKRISETLFTLATQISTIAYQNVQQARFITERKEAVEELQKTRNYIKNIIDSMPSVLIGVDPDGKITQWNSQIQSQTGISAENAIGQPLELACPKMAPEVQRVKEAIKSKQAKADMRLPRTENGETHYENITIYPLIANCVQGAVIRVDDVTEQVRIEEMMVQSEKMLSVGGLAAGMAHEINNPLGGMIQNAEVLHNRIMDSEMPANIKAANESGITMEKLNTYMQKRKIGDILSRINESGNRAASIVSNILSFARQSNSLIATHNIVDLLDNCVNLAESDYDLKKKFDFKHIKIEREYHDVLPNVYCDPGKIQQVFLNILRNGAEAMKSNSQDSKPKFILRLGLDQESNMVRIEIEDNGPGMSDDVRKRIFEPFFTTKPPGQGTGLGLSVSYFIITENHHGNMSVESAPGEGAKFIITLPAKHNKISH